MVPTGPRRVRRLYALALDACRRQRLLGGRYELRGILGRGGMAEVRDGWDIRLDRPVAVKLLHPAFSVQPDNRLRFEIEARAAASLNHPHIVAVHDSGDHGGTPFIVMERLSGRTLADELMARPAAAGLGSARFSTACCRRSPPRMRPESCTATSSRPTSCSPRPAK